MPIVSDVRGAWDRSLELTRKALGFGLTSHNSQVEELGARVNRTEGDIANIACMPDMPDKALRELSASVVALQPRQHPRLRETLAVMRWGSSRARWDPSNGCLALREGQALPEGSWRVWRADAA